MITNFGSYLFSSGNLKLRKVFKHRKSQVFDWDACPHDCGAVGSSGTDSISVHNQIRTVAQDGTRTLFIGEKTGTYRLPAGYDRRHWFVGICDEP